MMTENIKRENSIGKPLPSGRFRVFFLLLFALACQVVHFLLYPFPKPDSLTYLHAIRFWNETGSLAQVLEKFPKFGLLLFPFLPLKWADQAGILLFPASVVWMVLISLVSVFLFYRIVLLLTGDSSKAFWCGVLFSAHPMILLYAGNLLRDTPYLMFCLLHILVLIHALKKRMRLLYFLTGVTLGCALLCRFEAWELLLLSPLFALYYTAKRKFETRRKFSFFLFALLGLLIGAALPLAAADDLPLLYSKGKTMVFSFLPKWMGGTR